MLHSYYYAHHYVFAILVRPEVGVATEPKFINFVDHQMQYNFNIN